MSYQEEKHCLVLITHREFTREPPQKWFPFLHTNRSGVIHSTAECFDSPSPNAISCRPDLSLRLTVHGEFPGIPFTMRSRVTGMRLSLFPHSLNSTGSVFTKRDDTSELKPSREACGYLSSVFIYKLTYCFCQGQRLSSCLKATTNKSE